MVGIAINTVPFAGSSQRAQLPLLPVNPMLLQTQPIWSSSLTPLSSCLEAPNTPSPSVIVSDGIPPLPTKLVEKIRRWEYIDLSKLATEEDVDHNVSSTVVINGQVVVVEPTPQPRCHHPQLDIVSWSEAYAKYLAVLVAADTTSREEAAGLAAHMFQIIRLSRARGFKWLRYDMEYRQWAAAKNVRTWGDMNMSIYGRCLPQVMDLGLAPQSAEPGLREQEQEFRPCYRWNNGRCTKPCKFRHVCSICGGSHRKKDCPKQKKR